MAGPTPRVEVLECLQGKNNLTAYGKKLGRGVAGVAQPFRNRRDFSEIGRNVFADSAISSGEPVAEAAVPVDEFDPRPVEFGLGHVVEGVVAPEHSPDPLVKGTQLIGIHRVVEGEHRRFVGCGGKSRPHNGGSHALGGRLGSLKFRILLLQCAEFPQEPVVLGVADLGMIVLVVGGIVPLDFGGEGLDSALWAFEFGIRQICVPEEEPN